MSQLRGVKREAQKGGHKDGHKWVERVGHKGEGARVKTRMGGKGRDSMMLSLQHAKGEL